MLDFDTVVVSVAGIALSMWRIATVWTVRGSNSGGGEISASIQNVSGVHTVSYAVGSGSFPGVKRSGHGIKNPPQSSAEVNKRVELYLCSPSWPPWPVLGWTLHFYWMRHHDKPWHFDSRPQRFSSTKKAELWMHFRNNLVDHPLPLRIK
jgi:hypothetical protein